jgi:hypothetical protein
VVFIHNGVLLSHKEWNFIILKQMGGTGEHHLKWSWPESECQKSCSSSYADYRLKTNAVILLDMGIACVLHMQCTH